LNTAGLERAGYSAERLRKLEQALHLVLRSGLSRQAALTELAKIDEPLVAQLAAFVRSSARGFTREPRRRPISSAALAA
jgi:acyl-[acyl carrier protein]--UDP-N-acetylglucosamine O-acyltransferase